MFGAILDNSAEQKLKEINEIKELNPFEDEHRGYINGYVVKYDTPTKKGKKNYYSMNWPHVIMPKAYDGINPALDIRAKARIEKFYSSVPDEARIYVDNTVEFINYLIEEANKKYPGIQAFPWEKFKTAKL
jgi:hypothetical protein